ncbi:hypothetical protein M3G15_08645 [Paenibacillus sp. p3-SID1389]|uniref:hypothetical protein n=1 Tax=Paenibacillus sp. p3-SID1389 TaxID=2916364 RepID=UPI0021A7C721|nr:hypothetical protein [Paenibacillus sp. p3-SID1389]MCT2195208.1 hypothetical protein [Paenibacillus sp. p3-SID1389]
MATLNKALLKRMAGEVSVGTLAEMVVDYAQGITDAEDVDDGVLETIGAIETLVAEIKARSGAAAKPKRSRRESKPQEKAEETPPVPVQLGGGIREQVR